MRDHLVAVDIGTASVRAGIFDRSGRLIARETHPILLNRPDALRAEHASDDIWKAVTSSVRTAIRHSAIDPKRIAAIGFDATCSLVIAGKGETKVSIANPPRDGLDTISWMDHRALGEAEVLSRLGGPVVERAGGTLSPEMALPKLLWLKNHRPDIWTQSGGIFDLADYMTYRATGSPARSVSTLASKWGFAAAPGGGWPLAYLQSAGLADLPERTGAPAQAVAIGTAIGTLTSEAAEALGLDR